MPTLPKAFCSCGHAMKPDVNGVILLAVTENQMPYYTVHADMHVCPECGTRILTGFGEPVEHFKPEFNPLRYDLRVQL